MSSAWTPEKELMVALLYPDNEITPETKEQDSDTETTTESSIPESDAVPAQLKAGEPIREYQK